MYFILRCPSLKNEKNGAALVHVDTYFELAGGALFKTGARLEPEEVENMPTPVKIEFQTFQGYKGPPPELKDLGVTVMSKRLVDVLVQAGVDNLELFPAVLKNSSTGQEYDYFVYNLLGLVSAVDRNASEQETFNGEAPNMDVAIHKLVLDESKPHPYLMFRLAENVSTILVHHTIKEAIEHAGIDTLVFKKPEDYTHL